MYKPSIIRSTIALKQISRLRDFSLQIITTECKEE